MVQGGAGEVEAKVGADGAATCLRSLDLQECDKLGDEGMRAIATFANLTTLNLQVLQMIIRPSGALQKHVGRLPAPQVFNRV